MAERPTVNSGLPRRRTLRPADLQAPIIVIFYLPSDPAFEFEEFYRRVAGKGFLIYPGKLTVAPTFRIGCTGRLGSAEMETALEAVRGAVSDMGYNFKNGTSKGFQLGVESVRYPAAHWSALITCRNR